MTLNFIRTQCDSPKRSPRLLAGWLLLPGALLVLSITLPMARSRGQEVPVEEMIESVDANVLMASAFSGSRRTADPPQYTKIGVQYEYAIRDSDEAVQLSLSVCADSQQAKRALFRSLPSAGVRPRPDALEGNDAAIDGFVSRLGCHVRVRNVSAVIRLSYDTSLLHRNALWMSLSSALGDSSIAPMGIVVDTPTLEAIELSKGSSDGTTIAGAYNVVCRGEPGLLFARYGQPKVYVAGERLYEFLIKRVSERRETKVRFARPTGEVGVYVVVHEKLLSVTKTRPTWLEGEKLRRHKEKYGLSDQERSEIIAKLRNRDGNLYEQQKMVMRLKDERASESVAVFVEILYSDRNPIIRQVALNGLVRIQKAEGLDHYRALAADRSQPEGLRSTLVQQIGKFGDKQDVALLRRIAREERLGLPPIYASKEQIAKLEQNRFDGVDVLLYELWIALGKLEAKAANE